jgi:hypothetical protein
VITRSWLVALGTSVIALVSCGSPVHDNERASLGPEDPNVHTGPLHRPGQPCLTCHGSLGPNSPEFSLAGTVFKSIDDKTGVAGAIVTFTTLDNDQVAVQTNAAGNFYIQKSKWDPNFPLHVSVSYPGIPDAIMASRIGRDGSCGDCHGDPASPQTVGHIYLVANSADFPK